MRVRRRGVGWHGQLSEALAGVLARPSRLALTAAGAALGLGSLVATIGLAQTAANQVSGHFDAIAATQVSVEAKTDDGNQTTTITVPLPLDAASRVRRLAGVLAAGTISRIADPPAVRTIAIIDPSAPPAPSVPVVAASPGLLDAVLGSVVTGRFFDSGHDARADAVVVLGANAAERLGINRIADSPTIFIGERPFGVIGIIDGVVRHTELLDAVIVPQGTAVRVFDLEAPTQLQIRTAQGAAGLVAHQAPIALNPSDPSKMIASTP
jgi:putative ABC transport system permease protein